MKYPLLNVPTFAAQESLMRALYAGNLAIFYPHKTFEAGWKSWFSNYVCCGDPVYRWVSVQHGKLYPAAVGAIEEIGPSFILVNSERQLIAYLKAHAKSSLDQPF